MLWILQDIHTYLIISFVAMCVLLFKVLYKKCQIELEKSIEDVKNSIEDLEKRKLTTERHLEHLRQELEEARQNVDKAVQEAEIEAKRITEKSAISITKAIERKQEDYQKEIEKIRTGLYSELQIRMSELIIKEIENRLKEFKTNREFQNTGINNAIKRLELLNTKNED
ncbi:MAG: hypothetical protein LBF65_00720 [Holosporales bacterium]|jgi:F-type H+-transporting ATPase subunit b|nr:hypothetical protein [Holosporales bacterium]